MKWFCLAAGGLIGTFSRYCLVETLNRRLGFSFAYGTFAVNLLGCFLIGLLATLADEKGLLSPEAKMLLMAGFCGAFTTFSGYALDTFNLARLGHLASACVYITLSVAGGLVLFKAGALTARAISS